MNHIPTIDFFCQSSFIPHDHKLIQKRYIGTSKAGRQQFVMCCQAYMDSDFNERGWATIRYICQSGCNHLKCRISK